MEKIFVYRGRPMHEIVQIYRVQLEDKSFHEREEFIGSEGDGSIFRAVRIGLERFLRGELILYPAGQKSKVI